MPTITISLKDLENLVGKKLKIEDVENLSEYAKAEIEDYNENSDELRISFGDTNLPYLWSSEGFARLIRGVLDIEKGLPKLEIKKNNYKIIVDKSVENVRPYIAGFAAKGKEIDDFQLKQLIQLQEKLCETFGRKRKKVSVGLYNYDKLNFPLNYKCADPDKTSFIPLESNKEMTLREILEKHPKGKLYAYILKDAKKYPIFSDSTNKILSFAPIINSSDLGKVRPGDYEIFFECTGDDLDSVHLTCNIFAYAFADRGFQIYECEIDYGDKKIMTPFNFENKEKLKPEQIEKILGIQLTENQIKNYLEKTRYEYNKGIVKIPDYRGDILHTVDIIEDIGIMYGFNEVEERRLSSYTIGSTFPINNYISSIRDILVGHGFQEILSPILTNKNALSEKMNVDSSEIIEIKEYMSESYSVVRNWLMPIAIEFLSKNKHIEYPQKIFEEGIVTQKNGADASDYEVVSGVIAHNNVTLTEALQIIDNILKLLSINYSIKDAEHGSFIPGRVGEIHSGGKKIGIVGEISPKVLSNWQIEVPVAGFELNITELFKKVKSSHKE